MEMKLLKTADGVPFTQDMKLFFYIKGIGFVKSTGVCRLYVDIEEDSMNIVEFYCPGGRQHVPIVMCYSSREAYNLEKTKKYDFSSVCDRCGTVANFMSDDPEKLPSFPVGIPSKWPGATEHLIDGNRCMYLQLEQMKARNEEAAQRLPRTT